MWSFLPNVQLSDAMQVNDQSALGQTYFLFTDGTVYMVDNNAGTLLNSGGSSIQSLWPGLPSTIDAAFVWSDGNAYFFQGSQCYQVSLTTNQINSGYPQPIRYTDFFKQ